MVERSGHKERLSQIEDKKLNLLFIEAKGWVTKHGFTAGNATDKVLDRYKNEYPRRTDHRTVYYKELVKMLEIFQKNQPETEAEIQVRLSLAGAESAAAARQDDLLTDL